MSHVSSSSGKSGLLPATRDADRMLRSKFYWKNGPVGALLRHMRIPVLLGMATLLAGCATHRPLPKYEKPLAKTQFQTVRTTAYTHTEADHVQYTNHNALGSALSSGTVNSAAADWSRWPAGTVFKVLETGELYRVDDYGWALSGRNTIDLYKPTRMAMNHWGVREVNIQVLEWGDINYSYQVLKPRARYPHVDRMLREMKGGAG
jgi:3D (Asp-Asp-Asp) domain-containing protein